MRVDIVTCLPRLLESPFGDSILKRAQDKGLIEIHIHDLRAFSDDKHKKVDDYAYGGGAGMVLMAQPLATCIKSLQKERSYEEVIFMTPDGNLFNQSMANEISLFNNILLICGHYKGIDQRIRDKYITREISIGEYVLSGGELAGAVVVDAVARLIPGVLSDETSALTDSYQDGLLAPPVYTRPADFEGMEVPKILLSGNQKEIDEWRFQQSINLTKKRRPDSFEDQS